MEASFMGLEKKFQALSEERNAATPPAPTTTLPPAPAP
jgi:hypothetical protein